MYGASTSLIFFWIHCIFHLLQIMFDQQLFNVRIQEAYVIFKVAHHNSALFRKIRKYFEITFVAILNGKKSQEKERKCDIM